MDTKDPLWILIKACHLRGAEVARQALADAELDFGLVTKDDVLRFIADKGLENSEFRNTKPLETYRGHPPIMVHAYTFRSGSLRGYIAFYCRAEKWIIKSFKKNSDVDLSFRKPRP